MKALFLSLLVAGMGFSGGDAEAAPFREPCDNAFWELNQTDEGTQERDDALTAYSSCVGVYGESSLIGEAKRYLVAEDAFEKKVEAEVEKQLEIARGEREGRIVRRFTEEDLLSHYNNPTGAVFAAIVTETRKKSLIRWRKDIEYEVNPDSVCKHLGFDKSLRSTKSKLLTNGYIGKNKDLPEEVIEFRTKGPNKTISHSPQVRDGYGMTFRYFTSIECEKVRKKGEAIDDFELVTADLEKDVRRRMEAPELSNDVAVILNRRTYKPKVDYDENAVKDSRRKDEGREFKRTEFDDNPFIFNHTIKQ
jgi:hypothetical protein